MKIPKEPYHGITNGLLYGILTGGDCIDYQDLEVSHAAAVGLKDVPDAAYALLIIEADGSGTIADGDPVARFKECDTIANPPTASVGMPLSNFTSFEVKGRKNLKDFRIIGIEPAKIHSVKVQFYA